MALGGWRDAPTLLDGNGWVVVVPLLFPTSAVLSETLAVLNVEHTSVITLVGFLQFVTCTEDTGETVMPRTELVVLKESFRISITLFVAVIAEHG